MHIEKTPYKGWKDCVRLTNGVVDLIITAEVGPRVIRFGFLGEPNEFCEIPGQLGQKNGDEWRLYGGHRFWHAPEMIPRTYYPDNHPVQVEAGPDYLRTIQPVETTTGIQKEMDFRLTAGAAQVQVTHRLRNTGLWALELAPWALSVMAAGGTAILPLPPRGSHDENLLPGNTLSIWAYTDLSDRRWNLGSQFILLKQDPTSSGPQKIGASIPDGWVAFARQGHLFVKQARYQPGAAYPDSGSSVEVFTDTRMTEIETLGPLTRLEPQGIIEHVERWSLFRDIPEPENDADVAQSVLPCIQSLPAPR